MKGTLEEAAGQGARLGSLESGQASWGRLLQVATESCVLNVRFFLFERREPGWGSS